VRKYSLGDKVHAINGAKLVQGVVLFRDGKPGPVFYWCWWKQKVIFHKFFPLCHLDYCRARSLKPGWSKKDVPAGLVIQKAGGRQGKNEFRPADCHTKGPSWAQRG
jgi:hypothetical protein